MFRAPLLFCSALILSAASAPAQTVCLSANDGPGFEDFSQTGNAWFAIKFVAPASFSVSRIEVFTGEVSAASGLDIWSHDSVNNVPLALLSAATFNITPTNAWQGADLSLTPQLSANNTYWIVWHAASGAQASLDVPGAQNGAEWSVSVNQGQSWNPSQQSTDRQWKYRLYGDCCAASSVYCTAGVTTNGCSASISSAGIASASASSGFVVSVASVEGQRQGLLFYGLSGPLAQTWGSSSSFLCVKPPTQRTTTQASGGTIGACDGAFSLDWNNFVSTHPSSLGSPFAGGETVWIQAWFRDPPSPKTTHLSNGLQFGVCP